MPDTLQKRERLPVAAGLVTFAGGVVAIVGTYWDDAWHTDRGRDSFFIAPHLTLYGGVLVAGAVALGWAARRWAASGMRGVVTARPLALALAGLAGTLVSAPVDDAWHRLFGRDAVLWSPPHLLGVFATLALVTGLLTGLLTGLGPDRGRGAAAVRTIGAALALAALLVPVMEYDSDVPQFAPLWYLPLVGVAVVLAAPIARAALGGRWPLARAALAYTVLRLLVVAALALLGRSTLIVPPVLVPALLVDIAAQREWTAWRRALAVTLAVHVAYLPWVWLVPHGTQVPLGEVPASLLVGVLAAWLAGLLATGRRPGRPARATAGLALLVLAGVVAAQPAWAHDPGQGQVRGHAAVAIQADGTTARVQVHVLDLAGGRLRRPRPGGAARPARRPDPPRAAVGRTCLRVQRRDRPARPGPLVRVRQTHRAARAGGDLAGGAGGRPALRGCGPGVVQQAGPARRAPNGQARRRRGAVPGRGGAVAGDDGGRRTIATCGLYPSGVGYWQ
jgi:hypothetical protein